MITIKIEKNKENYRIIMYSYGEIEIDFNINKEMCEKLIRDLRGLLEEYERQRDNFIS